jgi:hypothetical protein
MATGTHGTIARKVQCLRLPLTSLQAPQNETYAEEKALAVTSGGFFNRREIYNGS